MHNIDSITTKRIKAERKIMQYIDQLELTDDPQRDISRVKGFMLANDLHNIPEMDTFMKTYFSEKMLNSKTQEEHV